MKKRRLRHGPENMDRQGFPGKAEEEEFSRGGDRVAGAPPPAKDGPDP